MIKYTLLSFQFLGLLFLRLFSGNDPVIDNQTPTLIAPGDKKEVTITIQKDVLQGFAKMEIVLPPGLKATAGNTQGASFTFSDQKARFVWMSLPTEPSFSVTYFLECSTTIAANLEIKGAFSYIHENKRVDYSIPVKSVSVTTGTVNTTPPAPPVAEAQKSEVPASGTTEMTGMPAQSEPIAETPVASAPAGELAVASQNTAVPATPANTGDLVCSRTITRISDMEFLVELRLANNSIQGFAKILEVVPANCKTEKIQDAGAVVTQEKNSIKFVWFEIPQSSEVDISYKISCLAAQEKMPEITGKLSYVENNNPKELGVVTSDKLPESLAGTEKPIRKDPEPTAPPVNETAEEKLAPPVKPVKPSVPEVTSVPSPENGVVYKVQILASHRVVNKTYFKQAHRFSGTYNIENHEGWVKYTTGKYSEYKEARDARVSITSDYSTLPGPFVTAYNDGQRITVQEALLISKQQWYQ